MTEAINAIHRFWFGQLDASGLCTTDRHKLWFGASAATDNACSTQFGALLTAALQGKLDTWTHSDSGLIALVVLLDQFSRHIYRGRAAAFAGDERALLVAQQSIAKGRHLRLPTIHRVFLYLPLEHSEDRATQDQSVALFDALAQDTCNAQITRFARYAQAHRQVVAQFGRFPHRNAILQRNSTAKEQIYLEQHRGF